MTQIEKNAVVLFQGDSITDWGRDRNDARSLGHGYPLIAASLFGHKYPEKNVKFLNRGIGGDRVVDLQRRWQEDCLDLHPTWLSIYVGINDTWRRYADNEATSADEYYEGYRKLILRAKESLDPKLVLIEPFVLPYPADRKQWREDLDPKIGAVRELAREFKTLYVPLDGLFTAVSTQTELTYWAEDGVHPTAAGHALIAEAWLKAVGAAL